MANVADNIMAQKIFIWCKTNLIQNLKIETNELKRLYVYNALNTDFYCQELSIIERETKKAISINIDVFKMFKYENNGNCAFNPPVV